MRRSGFAWCASRTSSSPRHTVRHDDVAEHQVDARICLEFGKRLRGVAGHEYAVTARLQRLDNGRANVRVVLDDENGCRGGWSHAYRAIARSSSSAPCDDRKRPRARAAGGDRREPSRRGARSARRAPESRHSASVSRRPTSSAASSGANPSRSTRSTSSRSASGSCRRRCRTSARWSGLWRLVRILEAAGAERPVEQAIEFRLDGAPARQTPGLLHQGLERERECIRLPIACCPVRAQA